MSERLAIEDMRFLLTAAEQRRQRRQADRLQRMAELLNLAEQHGHRLRAKHPETVNVFKVLDVRHQESVHSDMLAWLLDAAAGHSQGPAFLLELLACCNSSVDRQALRRYHVRRELKGAEATIDIAVFSPGAFVVYIENKVYAPEQPHQVARELADLRRHARVLNVPLQSQLAIFLTPNGQEPISGDAHQWRSLAYADLAHAFRPHVTRLPTPKLQGFLADWLQIVEAFAMP